MSTQTTQRFEGRTIEEALSAAVSSIGDDLDIVDAQRVRRGGVMGIFAKEHYQVVAAPKDSEARFEAVLAAMVDRVDDAELYDERSVGSSAGWDTTDFVLPAPDLPAPGEPHGSLVIEVAEPAEPASPAEALVAALGDMFHPDDDPLQDAGPYGNALEVTTADDTPVDDHVTDDAAAEDEPSEVASPTVAGAAAMRAGEPHWDRASLLELGVPDQIVERLPPQNPRSDLEWVAALAAAIEGTMPAELAAMTKIEVTAHGTEAVVDLLRGATAGLRPTNIVIDGHSLAATPMELALAVRSCLRREAA